MKRLFLCSLKPNYRYIFFDERGQFDNVPEGSPKQQALEYLEFAKNKSILLGADEYKAIKGLVELADMSQVFRPKRPIPDRVVVDFFCERPLLINLNKIIQKSRELIMKNSALPFNEVFKTVVAYYKKLIDTL